MPGLRVIGGIMDMFPLAPFTRGEIASMSTRSVRMKNFPELSSTPAPQVAVESPQCDQDCGALTISITEDERLALLHMVGQHIDRQEGHLDEIECAILHKLGYSGEGLDESYWKHPPGHPVDMRFWPPSS